MTLAAQSPSARLAALVGEHVAREEAFLTSTLDVLKQVRSALVGGDSAAITAALARQDQAVAANEDMRAARLQFRAAAAQLLNVAADMVTLERLSRLLTPEAARRLRDTRDRLRRLADDVARLNYANAWLTRAFLDFLNRFVADLTGAATDCQRYGRQGTLQAAAHGSLIQARG